MTQNTSSHAMKLRLMPGINEGSFEGKTPTFQDLKAIGENPLQKAISGTPEEIAHQLQGFADVGVTHLMVVPEPSSMASIEQFGRVIELMHHS